MYGFIQALFGRKKSTKKTVTKDNNEKTEEISPSLPSERKNYSSSKKYNQKGKQHFSAGANKGKSRMNKPLKDRSLEKDEESIDINRFIVDVSGISWDDIAGMDSVKEELQEVVALLKPSKETQEAIEHYNIETFKGMLMYGPPGCGKTMVAKALAAECNATFYLINGPEIKTKWIGESARVVREVYRDAQNNKPAIIFIDEIDSVCMSRETSSISETTRDIVNSLLTTLDGLQEMDGVFTIGATNRPELLDSAILRSGRLGKGVRIDLPAEEARRGILEAKYSKIPLADDIQIDELVESTAGYSGADIAGMVSDSARYAWRRNNHQAGGQVSREDIEKALRKGSSVSQECVAGYKRWEQYAFQ